MLLREFAKRFKHKNNLETLGLVKVCYPDLEKASKTLPDCWEKFGFTQNDWQDFLKVCLDFYIRGSSIIYIDDKIKNWLGITIYPKAVVSPTSDDKPSRKIKKWPQVNKGGQKYRLIKLLEIAGNFDLKQPENTDKVNEIMKVAWKALKGSQVLKEVPGNTNYYLDPKKIAFTTLKEAWVCPLTHRFIDTVFRGYTPYLPSKDFKQDPKKFQCLKIAIPVLPPDDTDYPSFEAKKAARRAWIEDQKEIKALRKQALWSDLSDRAVEGGQFFRAEEHSAQQPASKLKNYEAWFEAGKINVLNCSTTMEMGVDIGGISMVAMNNVPPHPANYLQRAGRAGRRSETRAVALTVCKDNPHEQSVFANPLWPFTTQIPVPYITLNSQKIVQRHINALILSYFLKKNYVNDNAIKLNCEWFFISSADKELPFDKMIAWLQESNQPSKKLPNDLQKGINYLVKDVTLKDSISYKETQKILKDIKEKWFKQYNYLDKKLEDKNIKDIAYKRKLEFDLKGMKRSNLLVELVRNGFLPAYSFPTGIKSFDYATASDYKSKKEDQRDDNLARLRGKKSTRSIDMAIYEYAPGMDVVVDGKVYRSAGIILTNYYEDNKSSSRVAYRCHNCGHVDDCLESSLDDQCPECQEELKPKDQITFIEPEGFAVDFYENPTNNIEYPRYIARKEPWVTIKDAKINCKESQYGDYRSSTEGAIFYYSEGQNYQGFDICLICGRAGSSPEKRLEKPHKPLKRKKTSDDCLGDEKQAIKKEINLGASKQTDVFELYLKTKEGTDYSHTKKDPIPWTLAVVLRQALASIHGIDISEIGYTVKPRTFDDKKNVATIVLFDRCEGGAGFSSIAGKYIKKMFKRAGEYLQCRDRCEAVCQSCLLGRDTQFHKNLLNRHSAIKYLEQFGE